MWLTALAASAWGLYTILVGTVKDFDKKILNFTPDTLYIHWDTTFPAVSVCEKFNYHSTLKSLNAMYPEFMKDQDFNRRKYFSEMMFPGGVCLMCNGECNSGANCSVNWRAMADTVRKPCPQLIANCTWMDQRLDCCAFFLPVDSELGTCYTFNTVQSDLSGSVPILQSNRSSGPGKLTFSFMVVLEVYIHGIEDVPWNQIDSDMHFDTESGTDFYLDIIEMHNSPKVRDVSVEIRKCRYPDENYGMEFYKAYGYTVCVTACETRRRLEACGCVHHLRDTRYKSMYCNYTGLGCLANYIENTKNLGDTSNDCVNCLPSCSEVELKRVFQIFYSSREDAYDVEEDLDSLKPSFVDEQKMKTVEIRLNALPTLRYNRNVVRDRLDFVVSIGGLAGLFFGASLLSLVEVIYYICIRNVVTKQ